MTCATCWYMKLSQNGGEFCAGVGTIPMKENCPYKQGMIPCEEAKKYCLFIDGNKEVNK